jgi:hypothetical protein
MFAVLLLLLLLLCYSVSADSQQSQLRIDMRLRDLICCEDVSQQSLLPPLTAAAAADP